MKYLITTLMLFASIPAAIASDALKSSNVKIDSNLVHAFQVSPKSWQKVVITLREPAIEVSPVRYQKESVVRFLKNRTDFSMQSFTNELSLISKNTKSVKILKSFWIANSIAAKINTEGLKLIAQLPSVRKIYLNGKISYPASEAISSNAQSISAEGSNYAFTDTKRYDLMKELPNVDGTGVVIGNVDTGVDGNNPALKGKILRFYDAASKSEKPSYDAASHGTHTSGTMVGSKNLQGMEIGMAPGANLVATAALTDYDTMLVGMQWMLDPDKNPNTKDLPRAINNSWNCGGAPDKELFYKAIDAWEAAGILPVFSAGNNGPSPATITPPHEHPSAFAVAATGEDGKVTNFSSRGPGKFHGQNTEKPDLSAPGNNIMSSLPSGRFGTMSGTSMAAPHVTGASALIFQVAPTLTPVQARAVFLTTAKQLATNALDDGGVVPQWNAEYGHGKLDIYAAVKAAGQVAAKLSGLSGFSFDSVFGLNFQEQTKVNLILNQGVNQSFEPTQFETEDEGDWVSASVL